MRQGIVLSGGVFSSNPLDRCGWHPGYLLGPLRCVLAHDILNVVTTEYILLDEFAIGQFIADDHIDHS
jgi:hypothetical protein